VRPELLRCYVLRLRFGRSGFICPTRPRIHLRGLADFDVLHTRTRHGCAVTLLRLSRSLRPRRQPDHQENPARSRGMTCLVSRPLPMPFSTASATMHTCFSSIATACASRRRPKSPPLARIVTIVLVVETNLQRGPPHAAHRCRLLANRALQPGKQRGCGTRRFQADPLDGKPGTSDKARDHVGIGQAWCRAHLPLQSRMKSALSLDETSIRW